MTRYQILSALTLLVLSHAAVGLEQTDSIRSHAAAAHADGRTFDTATGDDVRHFPPDPQVDFRHIQLDMRFDDPMTKSFACTETITFRTRELPLPRLTLDAVNLDIQRISDLAGNALTFRYDGERLTIRFAEALAATTDGGVRIEYTCHDPKDGMFFVLPDDAYPDRPLQVHTQGQTESNRHWFICHDHPNARSTTEVLVTLPQKYVAVSNGKLLDRRELGDGMVRYHYRQDQPHVAYLVALVLGEFAVVRDTWRDIPVNYWIPPAQESLARRTLGRTPEMIGLCEKVIGVDYPYAKYDQAVVFFHNGAMENTTLTTIYEGSLLDQRAALDHDIESLVFHELAHQWFGDMVTCKSWPHTWLNEGFATFMQFVWSEHAYGQDRVLHEAWRTMRGVAKADQTDFRGGIVFDEYEYPFEVFWRHDSYPYHKGASVLRMLQHSLGDELFWQCVRTYLERYAWQQVETDDLRKVVDDLSGRSYERFFRQWVYRPGVPHLSIEYAWDDDRNELRITCEQTQPITRDSPAFIAELGVWLVAEDGAIEKRVLPIGQRVAAMTATCEREPLQVCIDPEAVLLAKIELNLPRPMLVREARQAPTVPARLYAIRALAQVDSGPARRALQEVMLDEQEYWGTRAEAAESLGSMQQQAARDMLAEALADAGTLREHRVRRAAMSALGTYRDTIAAETLLRYAEADVSYGVEAAATSGLGNQTPTDAIIERLVANTAKASYRDRIRTAAIQALAELRAPQGLEPARQLAAYGAPYRSRPTGIRALATLARNTDGAADVRDFLVGLLADSQEAAANAAIDALAILADKGAIEPLQAVVDSSAPKERRDRARKAIDTINQESGETDVIRALRERIDKLEDQRKGVEKRLLILEERRP